MIGTARSKLDFYEETILKLNEYKHMDADDFIQFNQEINDCVLPIIDKNDEAREKLFL